MLKQKPATTHRSGTIWRWLHFLLGVCLVAGLIANPTWADEEVSTQIRHGKQYEVSTGFYEEYEVKPRHMRPLVGIPGVARGRFPYSPTGQPVRIRTRLADSHQGVRFYQNLRCEVCHTREAKNLHTTRANITCRQCHGAEPIASIQHFYSPMNPIRRHAYICAKCHEGASASFASYINHEPHPLALSTQKEFPLLFYAVWFMVLLAAGTFMSLLPQMAMWGLREFLPPALEWRFNDLIARLRRQNAKD